MKPSRWHRWKKNERERARQKTPSGRRAEDLPDWQIAAKKTKLLPGRAEKASVANETLRVAGK